MRRSAGADWSVELRLRRAEARILAVTRGEAAAR